MLKIIALIVTAAFCLYLLVGLAVYLSWRLSKDWKAQRLAFIVALLWPVAVVDWFRDKRDQWK
jgi:hypothetical protein